MRLLSLICLSLLLALGLSTAAAAPRRAAHRVELKQIQIRPPVLRVHAGDSVTWDWQDKAIDAQHTVTSYGKLRFRSAPARFSGTYTVRFKRRGTFTYMCTIHDNMRGRIIVR